MSSGRGERGSHGRPEALIVAHSAEDLVADAATESADGFGLRVAGGPAVSDVRPAAFVDPHLGDRDPVERDVELAVPLAVQAVALVVAGPDRDRGAPVVTGKGSG